MISDIKIRSATIIYPGGAGGNFLCSLLFDKRYTIFNEDFNEYKINYEMYRSENDVSATCWFYLDDSVSDNKQREKPVSNEVRRAVASIPQQLYHSGLGHNLPIETLSNFNVDFPYILEIVSTSLETDLILKILSLYKNAVYTNFSSKPYQISDLLFHCFSSALYNCTDIRHAQNKIKNVSFPVLLNFLNDIISTSSLVNLKIFSKNSLIQWMYIFNAVVKDDPITLDNFLKFIFDDLLCFNSKNIYTIDASFSQNKSREYINQNFPGKMDSIEYSELFLKLNIPSKYVQYVQREYSDTLLYEIARYTQRNMKFIDEIATILPYYDSSHPAKMLLINIKNTFLEVCESNKLPLMNI